MSWTRTAVLATLATSASALVPLPPFPAALHQHHLRAQLSSLNRIVCSDAPSPPPAAKSSVPDASLLPQREVDSRGFVVPQVGDVVKMPSKWPGEWDVAQVDFVQFIGSRGAYEVDLLPLKPIGENLYRMPGKKPSAQTLDVGKLGRLPTVYVPERDAFRVNSADLEPIGGRKKENPDVTAEGLREYAELKQGLLVEAAILGAVGTAVSFPIFGSETSLAFGLGAVAGCSYVLLLSKEADAFGSDQSMGKLLAALVSGRLGLPVVLFAFLASRQIAGGGEFGSFSLLPKEEFAAGALGFLSYKLPLFVRNIGKALQELASNPDAEAPIEAGALPTGSLGVAIKLAQNRVNAAKRAVDSAQGAPTAAAAPAQAPLIVLCGPSGVGKSTLIAKLLEDFPDKFGFSVSSTTRPPRAGEVDGKSYYFLPEVRAMPCCSCDEETQVLRVPRHAPRPEVFLRIAISSNPHTHARPRAHTCPLPPPPQDKFDTMIANDEFIEWAQIGGARYGTSVDAVKAVSEAGKLCLMDLDVQGVEALAAKGGELGVRPFCVWVAPPSLDALRARLRKRGTEQNEAIEERIARATTEIEYSLSARCFDKILLNDDFDETYAALKTAIDAAGL